MDSTALAPIGALLLVACLIAMLSRRLGLPYIVGLLVAGFLVALLPSTPEFPLSKDLIFNVFLPPLVFEAALQLNWREFRSELVLTLVLAFVGVTLAAAIVAAGMHWAVGWPWVAAALFGVLISATDPVSVIAAFREMGCGKRVSMIVESESLLNDGVAAVGFAVVSAIAAGSAPTAGEIIPSFLWSLGGGVLIGVGISLAILVIVGRTKDALVEITLTTITAYASFLIAEAVHSSGIISTLAGGLVVGSFGWKRALTDGGRVRIELAWEYFAFLANSFVFILIGMNVAHLPLGALALWAPVIAIVLVLAGRALSVYPLGLAFSRSRWKMPMSFQHTLFWGGMRGALALALALAVPTTVKERGAIILIAFIIVAFSILVQGLTMPVLIKRLRLDKSDSAAVAGDAGGS